MPEPSVVPRFSSVARWIWGGDDPSPPNAWRYFRRCFVVPTNVQRAALLITADSRYECSLNGRFLGRGPIRAFPFAYRYDVYDVTADLQPGETNVVAVLVNHLGDHTMSYIRGRGGLLCELVLEDAGGHVTRLGSDADWRTTPCAMFNASAPRISVQLEFEEQLDARQEAIGWEAVGFDDAGWSAAQEIGPVGCAPWTQLTARPIPFLTEDPVSPVAIKAAELARPRQGVWWNLDVREMAKSVRTGLRTAPPGERGWIVFTEVITPRDCDVVIHNFPNYERIDLRVNDTFFAPLPSAPQKVALRRGANLVMMRNVEWPSLLFETAEELTFSADRFVPQGTAQAAWVFSGPFNELTGDLERRWSVGALDDLPSDPAARVGIPAEANKSDIFALTSSQTFFAVEGGFCAHEITRATPRPALPGARAAFVSAPNALLHENEDWTTIHPQDDGDVHLVVDFGRELIGYVRLDMDAPDGAIIDANLFEGIDDTGIFWTRNTRNSMRYVCREGRQTFTSHQRRGFRYASLTFRNVTRPLRVRHLDTLLSTYPVEAKGRFTCSDETLTRIWEVAAYTVRLCMLDTYVDCPAYEQVYWVGDARISALVNAIAFGAYELTTHCVRLAGQSLSDGMKVVKPPYLTRPHLVTSHVVSGWFDEIPMWTFLWVWMVWEHYWLTGDREVLADCYADVRECLRRCEAFLTARDLLDIPEVWNLVDWSAMDLERDGEVVSNTLVMVRALECAANMAKALDRSDEAAAYTDLAERLRTAVNRFGWSERYQGYVDTVRDETAYRRYQQRCAARGIAAEPVEAFEARQRVSEQTNTLALLCNCVPPERREAVMRFVLAAREGKFVASSPEMAHLGSPDQVVPVGSPWFLFFTLETLFQEGYTTDALDILREQWNRMLEKGTTTFWETFPGIVEGGHWSRSLCHGWSAAPAYFLSTQVLGVTPAAPGYRCVRIAPHPFNLRWASGTVPTPHGLISVSWHINEAGEMVIEYDVPDTCEVEIVRPATGAGMCERTSGCAP
jgi:alpha-L-rhamnosidase